MKEKVKKVARKETPIFELDAFSPKASWTDFYIEDLKSHIKTHKFIQHPHKHDFYLVLYVAQGKGTHTIDFTKYTVRPNSVFLMTPGQVHSWNLDQATEGIIIFFTRAFYQMQNVASNLMEFPFFHSLDASPVIKLDTADTVDFVFRRMLQEYSQSSKPDHRLLRAYLDVMLLEAAKHYKRTGTVRTHASTFKLRKLEQLIEENFKTLKQPSDYASQMALAPAYLNSICKENVGKTLTELIQSRVLLEAKRLFAYSDLNVNEVAAMLNFSETSYFIRWFRKQSGLTPEAFRAAQTVKDRLSNVSEKSTSPRENSPSCA
ncbi:helix-turn-helix domain-containing protein [Pseudochryseolinea flava]|uniref:AraC family transcriptional regulator n=1 Tax=Pseudochryseolinea flava TaxID=2059302 RepID=A0A364Y7Y1_9BACT|nr:AraC family transcriptional regulator [Pseudochryseolinea flava]RAW02244.1 AraC family transcriptional regulator [Pseudochryseolinea flava]